MTLYKTACGAALVTIFREAAYAEDTSAYTTHTLQPAGPLESFEPVGDDLLEHAYQFFLYVSQTRPPSNISSTWQAPVGATQDQFKRGFEEWMANEFGSQEAPRKRFLIQAREINGKPEVIAEYSIWYGPRKGTPLYKFTYNSQSTGMRAWDPVTGSSSSVILTREEKQWQKKARVITAHHKDPQSGASLEKSWFETMDVIEPASTMEVLKYQTLALKIQGAYKNSAPDDKEKKE